MIIWHILFLKIWGQRIEVACFSFQTKPSHLKWYYWPNASQNAPFSADREARPGSARWMETGRNAGTPAMETMTAGHAKMLNSKAWAHSWVWWADNITFSLLVKKGKISLVSPSVAVIYCILALDVLRFRLFFFLLTPVCGQDPDRQELQSLGMMEGSPEIRDQEQRWWRSKPEEK